MEKEQTNSENVDDKKKLDLLVSKFIYSCNIPIWVVDSLKFSNLITRLCPGYLPPNSNSVAKEMLQIILDEKPIETEEDYEDSEESDDDCQKNAVAGPSRDSSPCLLQPVPSKNYNQKKTHSMLFDSKESDDDCQKNPVAGPSRDSSPCLLQPVPSENYDQKKSASMLLFQLYRDRRYQCFEYSTNINSRYKAVITIGDNKFEGIGSSKRLAKQVASAAALMKLSGASEVKSETSLMSRYRRQNVLVEEQQLADHVERLILEKYNDLMKNDSYHLRENVLSGIVMTRGTDLSNSEIIGITTGTKCVRRERTSMHGDYVNDLHAEILARRCLMVYLYDQLQLVSKNFRNMDDSIFESLVNTGRFKLKQHINFHLYIRAAPCGDARIFSPHEDKKDIDLHMSSLGLGKLRTKIKCGDGTILIKLNANQTWDDDFQSDTLLTMACSDKIARWNVLGLQGSLLSRFIDPIYLKSIIIGRLFNENHLYRAICGRLENTLERLPSPYILNRPQILCTTTLKARDVTTAPNFSVNWINGYNKVEIINAVFGKPKRGFSRLCKQNFLKRFIDISSKVRDCSKFPQDRPLFYREAKLSAESYNANC
ncbi:hypothetical protein FQR65_LT05638 [Abscondita terminalis]|nr:hypothetical protein FQR65_LT05638 [Abscondita terminalis]